MKKRDEVHEQLENFCSGYFDDTVEDVITQLQSLSERHPKHNGFYFDWDQPMYSDNVELNIWGSRAETDKEYKKRMDRIEKIKEKNKVMVSKKEYKELIEYERLKKKFG